MCHHHLHAIAAQPDVIALHDFAVDLGDREVGPVIGQPDDGSRAGRVNGASEDRVAFGVRWPDAIRCRSEPWHRNKIDAIALPLPEPVARYRQVKRILMCVEQKARPAIGNDHIVAL